MTKTTDWFSVDKEGLAALIKRRGAANCVVELIQNSLDTNAGTVSVELETISRGKVRLVVTDDDPEGFHDLRHAFTLFAPSAKLTQSNKRGRFNLGEKLVLSLCDTASIASTTGTVTFSPTGRTQSSTKKTAKGSVFSATINLTAGDVREVGKLINRLFIPTTVAMSYNGTPIESRTPVREWRDSLPTEVAGEDGILKPTTRKTTIRLFELREDEQAFLYEMGIPVVSIDGPMHVDIGQKVPLNFERSNVTPSYLRKIHLTVAENAVDLISAEQSAKNWVGDALASPDVTPETVCAIVEAKYGVPADQLVRYDPSDRDAVTEAQSQGYVVVAGGTFTGPQWQNINNNNLIPAAGQVTPSRNKIMESLGGATPEEIVAESEWLEEWREAARYATAMAADTLGLTISIRMVRSNAVLAATGGCYAATFGNKTLTFNVKALSRTFFTDERQLDRLLIHEFSHSRAHDHLSHEFHEACCRIGADFRQSQHRLRDFRTAVAAGS